MAHVRVGVRIDQLHHQCRPGEVFRAHTASCKGVVVLAQPGVQHRASQPSTHPVRVLVWPSRASPSRRRDPPLPHRKHQERRGNRPLRTRPQLLLRGAREQHPGARLPRRRHARADTRRRHNDQLALELHRPLATRADHRAPAAHVYRRHRPAPRHGRTERRQGHDNSDSADNQAQAIGIVHAARTEAIDDDWEDTKGRSRSTQPISTSPPCAGSRSSHTSRSSTSSTSCSRKPSCAARAGHAATLPGRESESSPNAPRAAQPARRQPLPTARRQRARTPRPRARRDRRNPHARHQTPHAGIRPARPRPPARLDPRAHAQLLVNRLGSCLPDVFARPALRGAHG